MLNVVQDLQLPEGIRGELLCESPCPYTDLWIVVLDPGRADYCGRTARVFQEIGAQSGS
jgi:hypothetical protein